MKGLKVQNHSLAEVNVNGNVLNFTLEKPLAPPWSVSCSVMSDSLRLHGVEPSRVLCPKDFPGKNTGMGSLSLLQGIFPSQGSNPGLPHCRWILYQLSHKGNPNSKDSRQKLIGWLGSDGLFVLSAVALHLD